jgi:hypothetical protein
LPPRKARFFSLVSNTPFLTAPLSAAVLAADVLQNP